MAEGDSRNRKYPFGVDGTEIAVSSSSTKPDGNGFINIDGAEGVWMTGSYTGDAANVSIIMYGYADENDNADPIGSLDLDTNTPHGKTYIEGGLPFVKVKAINSGDTDPATVKVVLNIRR